jgi:two-component system chemotaxis response regulator CheB
MASSVRVLIVDDSAFMRQAITKMLEREPGIVVVGTARSGEEAVEKLQTLDPDVITMDVEMPGMGGLEAVRRIMEHRRVPIIMVSALTREGAETTFRALELGAVDFIAKPDAAYDNIRAVARDLIDKILAFGRRSPAAAPEHKAKAPPVAPRPASPRIKRTRRTAIECIAIGTSTGGPVALSRVIPKLPANLPPILIVQHMPLGFTRPLADRLNAQSALEVIEGTDGMALQTGRAIVVPSGKQAALTRSLGETFLRLLDDDGTSLHVPSVDIMTAAVAREFGPNAIGVIMTGMGHDGVLGLAALKERGGFVIGQDEATCIVYGMPRAAAQAGLVDRVVPLDQIAGAIDEAAGHAVIG